MKKVLLYLLFPLFFLLCLPNLLYAQHFEQCATVHANEQLREKHPQLEYYSLKQIPIYKRHLLLKMHLSPQIVANGEQKR